MKPAPALLVALACLSASAPAPAQQAGPYAYDHVRALCVGIDNYKYLRPAKYAENDAREVGRTLKELYGFEPDYLLGRDATRAKILERLQGYKTQLGARDVLIVFFAGHGQVIRLEKEGRAGFLLPYEAAVSLDDARDVAKWQREALNMQELLDLGKDRALKAQHVLFMVDACCSGFLTNRGFEGRADLQKLLLDRSRMVLAATTQDEAARPDSARQHGVFTAALLDALKDASKNRSAAGVLDLFLDVRLRVARDSNQTMTPQTSRFADGDGEFVFLPLSLDGQAVKSILADVRRGLAVARAGPFEEVRRSAEARAGLITRVEDVIEAYQAADYRYSRDVVKKSRYWKQKLQRYQDSAALGDVLAMAVLHYCYAMGLGTEPDKARAFRWADLAFDSGAPVGKHVLGRCLYNGIGTVKNENAGLDLILQAAEKGFPLSLLMQGIQDIDRRDDYDAARRAWGKAVDAGVDLARVYLAQLDIGESPLGGKLSGVTPDVDAAIKVLLPAAQKDLPDAQFLSARLYARRRRPGDLEQARRWLEAAADNGHARAQSTLALELVGKLDDKKDWPPWLVRPLDLGLKPNITESQDWSKMALQQNDALAHLMWAVLEEAVEDYEAAREHCDKAAKAYHPFAFLLQSEWRYYGRAGLKKDPGECAALARRAAVGGLPACCNWLAALYADEYVPREMLDPSDFIGGKPVWKHHALHYFILSARQGDAFAIKELKDLAAEVRKNPKVAYWELFKRTYPEDVEDFKKIVATAGPPKP